jgi:hypothetical protein
MSLVLSEIRGSHRVDPDVVYGLPNSESISIAPFDPRHLALSRRSLRPGIGRLCCANAVTKLDPNSNSLSRADSGSIIELDMPKGRPSRLRKRPVTAGAIVIPIHFAIVVSLPRR